MTGYTIKTIMLGSICTQIRSLFLFEILGFYCIFPLGSFIREWKITRMKVYKNSSNPNTKYLRAKYRHENRVYNLNKEWNNLINTWYGMRMTDGY